MRNLEELLKNTKRIRRRIERNLSKIIKRKKEGDRRNYRRRRRSSTN